jgi:Kef-type K+ transport system membrane component KefB
VGDNILILVIIIGAAAIVPFIARRINVPSAILEIIFGIAFFNFFYAERPEWFDLLKNIGLIYLMFIAGMELDIRKLAAERRVLWYLLIPSLGFLIAQIVFVLTGWPWYLGIVAAVTSGGVLIPVLKESKFMKTPLGRDTLGAALTGELISIVILTALFIYARHGISLMAAWSGMKLLGLLIASVMFLKVVYVVAWWNPLRVQAVMESEDPAEEGIRAVLFVAFTGALMAFGVGVEPILGSFMGGLIFSYVFRSKGRFEDKVNAVGFGFFTPFFFIGVGADFDVRMLTSFHGVVSALAIAGAVLLSNVSPLFFHGRMGLSRRDALGIALLLSAPLSMMIVAGEVGLKLDLISQDMYGSVILAAVLTGLVCPFVFRSLARKPAVAEQEAPVSR